MLGETRGTISVDIEPIIKAITVVVFLPIMSYKNPITSTVGMARTYASAKLFAEMAAALSGTS